MISDVSTVIFVQKYMLAQSFGINVVPKMHTSTLSVYITQVSFCLRTLRCDELSLHNL